MRIGVAGIGRMGGAIAAQLVEILTNREALAAVFDGPDGLLSDGAKGRLFVEMSTVRPQDQVVECPVGGPVGPARQGELLGVAGAAMEDFEKAKPLFEQICRRVESVGIAWPGTASNIDALPGRPSRQASIILVQRISLEMTQI